MIQANAAPSAARPASNRRVMGALLVGGVCIKNVPDSDPEFTFSRSFRSTKDAGLESCLTTVKFRHKTPAGRFALLCIAKRPKWAASTCQRFLDPWIRGL